MGLAWKFKDEMRTPWNSCTRWASGAQSILPLVCPPPCTCAHSLLGPGHFPASEERGQPGTALAVRKAFLILARISPGIYHLLILILLSCGVTDQNKPLVFILLILKKNPPKEKKNHFHKEIPGHIAKTNN